MRPAEPGLWIDQVSSSIQPRPALHGDLDADVAIVGAGYTGLWTAYYLSQRDPGLRVVILEREYAGYGASGRNGGWCSALFPLGPGKLASLVGPQGAAAMREALNDTVVEVGRVAEAEGIDAGYLRSGTTTLALNAAQEGRLRLELEEARRHGVPEADLHWLGAAEAAQRVRVDGTRGALFTPHCARVQPARLARGLAEAVVRRGVTLHEGTPVTGLTRGRVDTTHGSVRAEVVVRATEGYTAALPGDHRRLLPLISSMVATAPLSAAFWDDVGWKGRETLNDGRHLLIYAQRTTDDRIAFGGRGAPYAYGSRLDGMPGPEAPIFGALESDLRRLFPALAGAEVTHRWCGPIGVPRDWFPSVGLDRGRGLAWAGGYVGDGVAASNLAGRTLADLITRTPSELAALPWVNHRSRSWEPEPLRWLAVKGVAAAMAGADRAEARSGHPARRMALVDRFTGH